MTADAAAIPDAETIVADVTVDVTMDADVTMAGVLPCLAAEEAAAPAFSGLSVSCAAPAFSGLSVSCAAAEIIMDADAITMAAVTTAAGLSSCFCSAAETTDVVATIAADLSGKKRQRLSPLPFLLPFLCFLLFLSFFLQTSQIYFIKSISINYQFLLLFRFHKTLQKNSSIYNMAAAGFPSYFHL